MGGYQNRPGLRERAVELARQGHPPRVIAIALQSTRNSIKSILSQERRRGAKIDRFPKGTACFTGVAKSRWKDTSLNEAIDLLNASGPLL